MSKMRILCLHGFTSNGQIHAYQIRKLVKAMPEYEFLFPEAPHHISDVGRHIDLRDSYQQAWSEFVQQMSTSGHRAWWFSREADPEIGQEGDFLGLDVSLSCIGDFIRRQGRVDLIWGFSQGACFAAMLCALLQPHNSGHPLRQFLGANMTTPKAGVIISGFRARFPKFDSVYEHGIYIPTLHVLGKRDVAVSMDRSEVLMEACLDPQTVVHEGAHDVPREESDNALIVAFVRKHLGGSGVVSGTL